MIFDADILGYFMNGGDNKEKGNLGYAPFAANPAAAAPTPNVWIWSLAMNNAGTQKDAAWYFMQWATSVEHDLFGARKMDFVNPVRASVWKDEEFRDRIDKSYPGYLNQHDVVGAGREDLLHRPAAVLRPHHRCGRRTCRRWWPRKSRSTKAWTRWRPKSTPSWRKPVSAKP